MPVDGDRYVACHFADELELTGFSRGGASRLPIHSTLPNMTAASAPEGARE